MNVPSSQFYAIPDHYNGMTYIFTLDSLSTVLNVGCSSQVLEILLEAVFSKSKLGSSKSFGFNKPLSRERQGLASSIHRPISRPGTMAALLASARA
jgi:hypothetical protein